MQEELVLCNPKPAGRAGYPEVRQLEEARKLSWGCSDSQLVSCVVLVHTHVNSLELWEKSTKRSSQGQEMLTLVWLVLD